MKMLILVPLVLWTIVASAVANDGIVPNRASLKCDVGPLSKTYGGTKWLVYSCIDGKSLVVTSAPENPAAPFYFIVWPQNEGIRVYGEGTGDKRASKAALDELESLGEVGAAKLVLETKQVPEK
jgi:hypothetical protein